MNKTELFNVAMVVAAQATKADPSLQFYVESPDGGFLLVSSNGCCGPFKDAQDDETRKFYLLEIKGLSNPRKV
ncbi:MAG: hypothetical protein WCS89_00615 [Candidatus Paceibacterota bacterium]|jgi:hypothetical protein